MLFILFICLLFYRVEAYDGDSSGIHLNIEYPNGTESSKLKLQTNRPGEQENLDFKTPTVIISPKAIVDYERLYKKLMNKGNDDKLEKEIIYDEKLMYSDPISRRELLFQLLKDVESRLAFYRADANEMEMVSLSKNSAFYAYIGQRLLNGSRGHASYDEILVTGLGTAIKVAIETAMLMSNRKIGTIKKIETSFYSAGSAKKRIPKISIIVARSLIA